MSAHDHTGSLAATALGCLEACLSVLFTIAWGALAARTGYLSAGLARDAIKLGSRVLLPALIITSIGAHLDASELHELLPLLAWALIFISAGFGLGFLGRALFALPLWTIPACALPNSTAGPLLLIQSLQSTGILDSLARDGESISALVKRGRVYVLVVSLVQMTLAFSVGMRVLGERRPADTDSERQPLLSPQPAAAPQSRFRRWSESARAFARDHISPPIAGALIALVLGLIPFTHDELLMPDGALQSIGQSLAGIGQLFPTLQAFTLGAALFHAKRQHGSLGPTAYVLAVRFVVMPAVTIPLVWTVARAWPHFRDDRMQVFIAALAPSGPPALLLQSLVTLAGHSEGDVASHLVIAYAFSPLLSIPCAGALAMIRTL